MRITILACLCVAIVGCKNRAPGGGSSSTSANIKAPNKNNKIWLVGLKKRLLAVLPPVGMTGRERIKNLWLIGKRGHRGLLIGWNCKLCMPMRANRKETRTEAFHILKLIAKVRRPISALTLIPMWMHVYKMPGRTAGVYRNEAIMTAVFSHKRIIDVGTQKIWPRYSLSCANALTVSPLWGGFERDHLKPMK